MKTGTGEGFIRMDRITATAIYNECRITADGEDEVKGEGFFP
jgi:hypothetical protein